jgi:hypothetical protein
MSIHHLQVDEFSFVAILYCNSQRSVNQSCEYSRTLEEESQQRKGWKGQGSIRNAVS